MPDEFDTEEKCECGSLAEQTTVDHDKLELHRRIFAEYFGTLMLLMIVVGSGIFAEKLSEDVGIQLYINTAATVWGLYCLITVLKPRSGAHFNPVVSMIDKIDGALSTRDLCFYTIAQIAGGISGSVLANLQFAYPQAISDKSRYGSNVWLSEVIATATLIFVIHGCVRTHQDSVIPSAVSMWVGGGYLFTNSTIFANPAVTIGRMFSKSFAGIQPRSAGIFICFQIIGAIVGYGIIMFIYPKKQKM